ncbi:MAG: alpha/beta hydrolase [Gammaproteobacteria bacterium]|nr:alpha/beta hydrolase [Gammaproteobacteria bacterium]
MYFDVKGKRVFATTGGKPFDNSKPVVIFLAGSGGDHTFWGLHARFFAFRKYSVLCPDAPGHTHSAGPALGSIEALADWLNEVVTALDIKDLSIVAHSQGCLVALEYASRFPHKLRSMSLITSGLATPVNDYLLKAANDNPAAAVDMMISWGFGPAGHLHQGPIPGNSIARVGYTTMWRNSPRALAADLHACNDYRNGKAAAAAVQCPVQVIIAGKDRMAPAKATATLVEHLPDPVVARISESGHMLPLEVPDQCRTLLKDFIFLHNPASQA